MSDRTKFILALVGRFLGYISAALIGGELASGCASVPMFVF